MVMNAQRIAMSLAIVCMVNQTAVQMDRAAEMQENGELIGVATTPAAGNKSYVSIEDVGCDTFTSSGNATAEGIRVCGVHENLWSIIVYIYIYILVKTAIFLEHAILFY